MLSQHRKYSLGLTLFWGVRLIAMLACLLAIRSLASGAENALGTSHSSPVLDTATTTAFADSVIPRFMREEKIPGAVFVVVQGDKVICEKAFGVSELKSQKPVSTDQTLFRAASISKILTAASALQLVDAGKLDLHRDVNDYLTWFQITPAFGRPITLFNLLTHSGGFDENEFGYASRSATNRLSLRDYLIRHQPARVRPPGLFSVYDNYGFALAGYLVQKASGLPFADYVQEKIFDPLDMNHSSFSPRGSLRKRLATGYWLEENAPHVCDPNYVNITPAAGLCTTASDMADFLVALLANRTPDGSKIFPDDVIRGLQTQQFAASPDVPGRCYGFDQVSIAGRSALRQPGQWSGFNSVLMLFPKQHCGLFLAYNLCDYEKMDRLVTRRFAEQFIPADAKTGSLAEETVVGTSTHTGDLTGFYLSSRATHEAPQLNSPRQIKVATAPDGDLTINGRPYREIKPFVFEKDGTNAAPLFIGRRLAFLSSPNGEMRLVTQTGVFRQVPWMASKTGQSFLIRIVTLVLISSAIIWLVMGLARLVLVGAPRESAEPRNDSATKLGTAARMTALVTCLLMLWFETTFALAEFHLKPFASFYGFPAPVQRLMWAPPVLLALTIALVIFTAMTWRRRLWHLAHRLHFSLVTTACAAFLYIFYARHLLFVR